ncbi:MAG TPA: hypothetical protein VIK21_04280, partial [Desulfuromonadaceae bacterium]
AVPEIVRITANLQRPAIKKIPAASRGIRLVAGLSESHSKAHRQYSKKSVKNHHRKSYGRTRRA